MNLLYFCLQSSFREYGRQFCRCVVARHPVKTTRALLDCVSCDFARDWVCTPGREPRMGRKGAIVAAGFCLKPLDLPCPSGRANHDCLCLERITTAASELPVPCRTCAIRNIGNLALRSGAAFYIMTSAKDILWDLYVPTLEEERFSDGLFILCRYSFQPFVLGLLASGLRARLVPLEQGDCRDYLTWLRADRGLKDEQTRVSEASWRGIQELLGQGMALGSSAQCSRRGNIFFPGD